MKNMAMYEIIDRNQTAYERGRSVADNLRSMMFLKDHCMEEQIEAALINYLY